MRLNPAALKVIRQRTELTQQHVAAAIGVERSTYASLEAGRRRGTANQIKAIARVLDCPVAALIQAPAEAA